MATPDYSDMLVKELQKIDDRYYQDSLDATANANANLSQESHYHHDLIVAQENLQASLTDSSDLNAINNLAAQADLVTKKLFAFSQNAEKDAINANAGVAVSATSIETAAEAIVELNSFLASVLSIANAEDARTSIDSSAAKAAKMAVKLAKDVEQLTIASMNAAILASQTANASHTSASAKELEKDIAGVAATMASIFEKALDDVNTSRKEALEAEQKYQEEVQELDIDTDRELALQDALKFLSEEVNLDLKATDMGGGVLEVSYNVYLKYISAKRVWQWDPQYGPDSKPADWNDNAKIFEDFRIMIIPADETKDFDLKAALALDSSQYNMVWPMTPTQQPNAVTQVPQPQPFPLPPMKYQAYVGPTTAPQTSISDPVFVDISTNPSLPNTTLLGKTIEGKVMQMGTEYQIVFWGVAKSDHKLNVPRETDLSLPTDQLMLTHHLKPAAVVAAFRDENGNIRGFFQPSIPVGEGWYCEYLAFVIRDDEVENFEGYVVSPESLQDDRRLLLANHIQLDNAIRVDPTSQQVTIPAEMTDYYGVPIDAAHNYHLYILTVGSTLKILQPGQAPTGEPDGPCEVIPLENLQASGQMKVPNVLSLVSPNAIVKADGQPPSQTTFDKIIRDDFVSDVRRTGNKTVLDLEDLATVMIGDVDAMFATAVSGNSPVAAMNFAHTTALELLGLFDTSAFLLEHEYNVSIEALKKAYPSDDPSLVDQLVRDVLAGKADPQTSLPAIDVGKTKAGQRTKLANHINTRAATALSHAKEREKHLLTLAENQLTEEAGKDIQAIIADRKRDLKALSDGTRKETDELRNVHETAETEYIRSVMGTTVRDFVDGLAASLVDPSDIAKQQLVNLTGTTAEGKFITLKDHFGADNEHMKRLSGQIVEGEVDKHASGDQDLRNKATVLLQEILNINWPTSIEDLALKQRLAYYEGQVLEVYNRVALDITELKLKADSIMDKVIQTSLSGKEPKSAVDFAEGQMPNFLADVETAINTLLTRVDSAKGKLETAFPDHTKLTTAQQKTITDARNQLDSDKAEVKNELSASQQQKFADAKSVATGLENALHSEDVSAINKVLGHGIVHEINKETSEDMAEIDKETKEDVTDLTDVEDASKISNPTEDAIRSSLTGLITKYTQEVEKGNSPNTGLISGQITRLRKKFEDNNNEARDTLITVIVLVVEATTSDEGVQTNVKSALLQLVDEKWPA
ncbi:MAG: hypothetical protein AAF587_02550 [Bacteroidota bacterium]